MLQKTSTSMLETTGRYVHPPHAVLVYIDPIDGKARVVPPTRRAQLLHLHRALHPDSANHHKQYVRGIERAFGDLAGWNPVMKDLDGPI
mmetsp:Transcript_47383/g.101143  ORF Transcript_47383/g.101143 Transcript_47383/m.101143 type:complete len:89 (-) Transcript_47383:45-311(-)